MEDKGPFISISNAETAQLRYQNRPESHRNRNLGRRVRSRLPPPAGSLVRTGAMPEASPSAATACSTSPTRTRCSRPRSPARSTPVTTNSGLRAYSSVISEALAARASAQKQTDDSHLIGGRADGRPSGWACRAVRAPGSNVTLPPGTGRLGRTEIRERRSGVLPKTISMRPRCFRRVTTAWSAGSRQIAMAIRPTVIIATPMISELWRSASTSRSIGRGSVSG